MKTINRHYHNNLQRVTADIINKMGTIPIENANTLLNGFSSVNSILKNGHILPSSGMVIKLEQDSLILKKQTVSDVIPVAIDKEIEITIPTADATNPRIDVIRAIVEEVGIKEREVDVINNLTKEISKFTYDSEKTYKLTISVLSGTPSSSPVAPVISNNVIAGTIISDGSFSGSVERDLSSPISLISKYNLRLRLDAGAWVTVDCRGADPGSTTLSEIVTAINTALGATYASIHLSKYLKLSSALTTESGKVEISNPASADATNIILGLVEEQEGYFYSFKNYYNYIKLAEVTVPAGATSISSGNILDVYKFNQWENMDNVIEVRGDNKFKTILANIINEYFADQGVTIEGSILKDGNITANDFIAEGAIRSGLVEEYPGSATGVTIDGVLLKDAQVNTDQINESPGSGLGVTVDGVLLKDSQVNTDQINEKTSATGVTIDGVLLKDGKVNSLANFHGSLQATTSSYGAIYNSISPYIPNIGNKLLMTGAISNGANNFFVSYAERISSTRIDIYHISDLRNIGTFQLSSSDGTVARPNIAW